MADVAALLSVAATPTAVQGIKIVKSGKDVSAATPSDFVLNSLQPGSIKISQVVTLIIATDGITQSWTKSYAHGLGYTPVFFAIVTEPSDTAHLYKVPVFSTGLHSYKVYADNTNIYASVITGAAYIFSFNVVIFKEKIA